MQQLSEALSALHPLTHATPKRASTHLSYCRSKSILALDFFPLFLRSIPEAGAKVTMLLKGGCEGLKLTMT